MNKKITSFICFILINFTHVFATELEPQDPYYPAGTVLQSPTNTYTVIDRLGEGAFGCVYLTENEEGKQFAIKSYKGDILDHVFSDPEREYQRGLQLDHPNIVKAYELFHFVLPNQTETTNLVLEYIDGQPLWKTERGQYDKEQSLLAVDQFLSAIKFALASGYIHMDLHGGNVMLDHEGNLKVIDLGSFVDENEVVNYVKGQYQARESSTKKSTSKNTANTPVARRLVPPPQNNVAIQSKEMPTNNKIEAFFNKHPEMLDELVNIFAEEVQKVDLTVGKVAAKSLYRPAQRTQSAEKTAATKILTRMYALNLNHVSDICLTILLKTNFEREEKIPMLLEIKKISLNCQEDLYEEISLPMESYLDELHELLGATADSR